MPITLPQLMGLVGRDPGISDYQGGARTMLQAQSQAETGRANQVNEGQRSLDSDREQERFTEDLEELQRQFDQLADEKRRAIRQEFLRRRAEGLSDPGRGEASRRNWAIVTEPERQFIGAPQSVSPQALQGGIIQPAPVQPVQPVPVKP